MKRLMLTVWCLALGATCALAEESLPRNPFWPQGFEGTRHPITLEPRFKPEPPEPPAGTNDVSAATNGAAQVVHKATAEELDQQARDKTWSEAAKALSFGSILSFSSEGHSQASIMINGRAYAVGDLVSADVKDNRFTWKIESLSSDGKIKLNRLNYSPIRKNP